MGQPKTLRDEILNQDEVRGMLNKADNLRDQSLIAFLYLSGCRISEVLKIRKRDFWMDKNILMVRIPISKRRRVSGIIPKHEIPISKTTPFANIIIMYLKNLSFDELLFDITRQRAWQIIKKLNTRAWPHLFRHTRLTKLARKGATLHQLMGWAGWKSPQTAGTYLHSSAEGIKKLGENLE